MVPTFAPSSLQIQCIRVTAAGIELDAAGTGTNGWCPECGIASTTVHDRYQRRPRDLPWRGHTVRLCVTVRRFRCRSLLCPRRTFVEQLGDVLPQRAQRSAPATMLLRDLALAVGGEAGSRLAHAIGLPVSPDTLLRLIRTATRPPVVTPRVLGVDDLALRRGCHYATILVDMETHRPIDLLPGREAAPLTEWLRAHPGVEIVVRDRAEAYAQGARDGAPDALQIADRFHLLQNASAALDDLLRTRRRQVEIAMTDAADAHAAALPPAAVAEERPVGATRQRALDRQAARVARWQRVRDLHARGVTVSRIADEVGIDRKTVRRLVATEAPPRNQVSQPRPGGLTSPTLSPYVTYLQNRWQQGCHNVSRLYRELGRQGYTGSRSLIAQAVRPWRPPRPPPATRRRRGRRSLRWLCLRPPDDLEEAERAALQQALADDEDLRCGYELRERFRAVIAARDVDGLNTWLNAAQASSLPSFVALAKGIGADRAAVDAALTTEWSNGLVEGHVHRVKLIKRQGYGRAKLDLLRQRVLAR